MTEYRAISGRRSDLTRVRRPELLRRILLDGPGIRSLAGIEQMTALETVLMEGVESPALERLASLPSLRELVVDRPRGRVPWKAIEQLAGLEALVIIVDGEEAGQGVASIDFGRLSRLTELRLSLEGARVPLKVEWRERLPGLRVFRVDGFGVEGGEDAPPLAPLGTIIEHATEYSLGLDLAGMWGLETNVEAEERLAATLRRRLPKVAARVRYDSESSAVWVLSERRDDLEAVQRLATEMAG